MIENSNPITCMDDYDPNSMTLAQGQAVINQSLRAIQGIESVALRSALDRILAADVLSPIDVPAYNNSAMDGYALHSDDLPKSGEATLKVVGTVYAGHPIDFAIQRGEAARIMTGAMIPEGTDTVIMQEHVQRNDDSICFDASHAPGQNVRMAGEDIASGGVVLSKGRRIIPADLGLLASLGIAEVRVMRRLRVAFFSTGDELRSIGEPLQQGQIYDSNRYTLHGMLSHQNCELIDMGVIPDQRDAIEMAFEDASQCADLIITTGGVSVGEADFVKETLEKLGTVQFWKLNMKPGRPLTFGKVGRAWFFGLPGNPVSTMATFYQFVQPAIAQLAGAQWQPPMSIKVKCSSKLKKRPGRMDFQRGILYRDETGEMMVKSTGNQGSHVLSSMSQANCFIVLALENGGVEPGDMVEVQPFAGLV